jgi:stage II sporulation protein AA (anti-sigma F factor antagonist)
MNYKIEEHYIIVCFYGEIDSHNAPYYREDLSRLIERTQKDIIFDFTDTSFIDSSGIGLVLGRYNQLKFEHRTLILTGLNPVAYRLFELTGLFQIMPYYESIQNIKEGSL